MSPIEFTAPQNKSRIFDICQGLPGAMKVLCDVGDVSATEYDFHVFCDQLAAMNIRRGKLWAAYSVVCDQNLIRFMNHMNAPDQAFVDAINAFAPHGDYTPDVTLPPTT